MLSLDGVELSIGSEKRRLRFKWAALIALHDLWGEEFERRVINAIERDELRDLSVMVVATTRAPEDLPLLPHEWDTAAADIVALDLPIRDLSFRLEVAWAYAYNGFEAATRFAEVRRREEAARIKAAAGTPPKSILSRFTSALRMRSRTRSEAA